MSDKSFFDISLTTFEEGVKAFHEGLSEYDNPYIEDTEFYYLWQSGYLEAWESFTGDYDDTK